MNATSITIVAYMSVHHMKLKQYFFTRHFAHWIAPIQAVLFLYFAHWSAHLFLLGRSFYFSNSTGPICFYIKLL